MRNIIPVVVTDSDNLTASDMALIRTSCVQSNRASAHFKAWSNSAQCGVYLRFKVYNSTVDDWLAKKATDATLH